MPLPKLLLLILIAVRVGLSNMLNSSSMFTGSLVWLIGIVLPALIVACELPRLSSRYLSPIVDTDSTSAVVLAGSGSTFFSSFSEAIAVLRPVFGFWCGLSELIVPTRVPPRRTWFWSERPEA